jgi:hypothetical protein
LGNVEIFFSQGKTYLLTFDKNKYIIFDLGQSEVTKIGEGRRTGTIKSDKKRFVNLMNI